MDWQHCRLIFWLFLNDLQFVVSRRTFAGFLLDFCYFKNKSKIEFYYFFAKWKFENLRFCLNGNCVIGTVTFAFCRKLKNSIVDFDLKIFF